MLRRLTAGFLDLLAPPCCPGCGLSWERPRDVANGFCPACSPLLELPPAWLRPPARAAAALVYQGPLADAVRRFKYGSMSSLAAELSELLVTAAQPYAGRVDAVVPMPLHPSKLRARGWNPSTLLARPVARALGVPMRAGWLSRRRATSDQAGLNAAARQRNVFGAFVARPTGPVARVLLIDDVRTTGATLAEAARALSEAGYDVTSLALAWAPDATCAT
jgi:ComF family protein